MKSLRLHKKACKLLFTGFFSIVSTIVLTITVALSILNDKYGFPTKKTASIKLIQIKKTIKLLLLHHR